MIIAIDGPSAAGKGTLAKGLAEALGYDYLDSGSLYRAVALLVADAGVEPDNSAAAAGLVPLITKTVLSDPRLRAERTAAVASVVAKHPAVREALLGYQRDFAENPPGGVGAILDGRDIGSVVCPDADIKLFVTASAAARAERRTAEMEARGEAVNPADILADINRRDEQDRTREIAPLVQSADAHLLDTTKLDIEAALERALAIVRDAQSN